MNLAMRIVVCYNARMAGNSFGELFKITTFGESHGPAIGVVIDGVPPKIALDEADIQTELDRRRPGQSRVTTPRDEADKVEILSGVFEGQTTGVALALLIRNQNQQSKDYSAIKDVFRPGHADYSFWQKYGIRDYRGGGRSSGRETAARVAAGAVAKKVLAQMGIRVVAYTVQVGHIRGKVVDLATIESNIVRAADPDRVADMVALIDSAKADGDSVGGIVECQLLGVPVGLGDPVFDKLDALLGHAMLSIGTIKGIEFGSGFAAVEMHGSQSNDVFYTDSLGKVATQTNHAGGILGGISTGQPIVFRLAVKPPSSISKSQQTVNVHGEAVDVEVKGRHDPCICPRVVPVVEAMAAIVTLDRILVQHTIR